MATILEIKKEMKFNSELFALIETLKTIASAQFRALVQQKERFGKFLQSFGGFFELVDLAGIEHPLIKVSSEQTGIIMLTSDMGFMGGLNRKVIETGLEKAKDSPSELIVIGERGAGYLKDLRKPFTFFPGIITEKRYEQALRLRDYVVSQVKKGNLGRVFVVYPKPISFMIQRVVLNLSLAQNYF
jgi:F0F1-type ATP synthase gamma subunit